MEIGRGACTDVMVVEDDKDTREIVKLILELNDIHVIEAADGLQALDALREMRAADGEPPCAILLDLMMPRCSGLEFRRIQMNDPAIADVPVIVLSAVADRTPLEELHPYAKIGKPFDPDRLVEVVRSACCRGR